MEVAHVWKDLGCSLNPLEDSDQMLPLVLITQLPDNLLVLKCSSTENRIGLFSTRELGMPPRTTSSIRATGFRKGMDGQSLCLSEEKGIFVVVRHSLNRLGIGYALTKCPEESKRWSH